MIRYALTALAALTIAVPAMAQDNLLAAQAGSARYALAGDEGLFLDTRDPQSRAVFEAALGGDNGALGDLWSRLMAGAIQIRHENGDTAETLWFNPLFDAGLATRWERWEYGWRAVAATPVTGEMLRGEKIVAAPVQWGSSGSLKAAVEVRARASWAASANGGWLDRDATGAGTAALVRAMAARNSLDELRAAPGYEDAVMTARQMLVTGDAASLPSDVRNGLALLGQGARLTLRPVAGYRRPDGWTLALQSPDAPRMTWLVHFVDPAGAASGAGVKGFQSIDLGGAK